MRACCLFAALVFACLGAAFPAQAENAASGNILASFRGGFFPSSLPRTKPAPIRIHFAGDVKGLIPGTPPPPLWRVTFAINNSGGHLSNYGLPTCRRRLVQPGSEKWARERCGDAIVGSGIVIYQVRLPEQLPYTNKAKVLFFNAPGRRGTSRIFAQTYSETPPASFIVPVSYSRRNGILGTIMTTVVPRSLRSFISFRHFDMTLQRTYFYRGKRRSLLSAACAAPAGFPGAIFPLAKITYDFSTGQRLTTTIVRSCTVRKG